MAVPGTPGCMYTADGLEHTDHAIPTPSATYHHQQLDKRLRKLTHYDYGAAWGEVAAIGDRDGDRDGGRVVICWGSLYAAAVEAQQLLMDRQIAIKVVALRLISPLPQTQLLKELGAAKKVLVVEQNHQGQLTRYLRGHPWSGIEFVEEAQPGPNLITPAAIVAAVEACYNLET